jgi:hypothetical protein
MASKRNQKRTLLMKLHGHKYKRHFTQEGYYCFYCADPADTLDHVPPLSAMDILNKEKRKKEKIPATLVPCCAECNSALGARQLWTVFDRLMYLESYYDAYFKRQKMLWTEEEINELGPSLRESVRHRQDKLDRYRDKIRAVQVRQLKPETYPEYHDDDLIDDEEYAP